MEVKEASARYLPKQELDCPLGYKKTEVGVIPEDWEVKTLDSIADYTNGKAHEGCIRGFGKYIVVNSKFISTDGEIKKYSNVCLSPTSVGEILMVMSDVPNGRAIARCFFVDCDDFYTVNQRICSLRPTDVNGKLLFYKLNRNPYYLSFDDGVKQTNLRKDDVLSCPLGLPPTKAEQEAIAWTLSDTDALIESLEQLIAKKRHIKQGAMQELLRPKNEWVNKPLEEIFELTAGRPKSKYLNESGKFVVMDMGSVSIDGRTLVTKMTDLEEDVLECGDLVMPKDDIGGGQIIGKVAYIDANRSYVLGDHVYRLRAYNSQIDTKYFYYLINSQYINSELKKKVAGSAQLGLGRSSVLQQIANYPKDISEQISIAEILTYMDAEITALETQLAKTRQLKQGMMHELLTGRIRLVKPAKVGGV